MVTFSLLGKIDEKNFNFGFRLSVNNSLIKTEKLNVDAEILYQPNSIIKFNKVRFNIETGVGYTRQNILAKNDSDPFYRDDVTTMNHSNFSLNHHYLYIPIRISNQFKLSDSKPILFLLNLTAAPSLLISGTAKYTTNIIVYNPYSQVIGTEDHIVKYNSNKVESRYFSPVFNVPISVDLGFKIKRTSFGITGRYFVRHIGKVFCAECYDPEIKYHLYNAGLFLSFNF